MRNLRNIRYGAWLQESPSAAAVTSACWDPAKDEVLCTTGPTEAKATIELVRLSDHQQQQQMCGAIFHLCLCLSLPPSPLPSIT